MTAETIRVATLLERIVVVVRVAVENKVRAAAGDEDPGASPSCTSKRSITL